MTGSEAEFAPEPWFPQNAEFYRQVLHELPTPMFVVDGAGDILYGNKALQHLTGWDPREQIGTNLTEYVDPLELDRLAEAFVSLTVSDESDRFGERPWPAIQTRVLSKDGLPIPVTVTGTGGLEEPAVRGVVYDMRLADEQELLRRILNGVAQGDSVDALLGLVAQMVALPPLELDVAVLKVLDEGSHRVITATNTRLREILGGFEPQGWMYPSTLPKHVLVGDYPGAIGDELREMGYVEVWHVGSDDESHANAYRIIACGRVIEEPALALVERLTRIREVVGVVQLRSQSDARLQFAATHDSLTGLVNRVGFQQLANDVLNTAESKQAAMLFVDLDGFKEINDDHGHAMGDWVLASVAQRLRDATRSVDLVGRFGGDEFVVLVGTTAHRQLHSEGLRELAERVAFEIRREIDTAGGNSVKVGASIGGVVMADVHSVDDLIARADTAMYAAKRNGGNRSHIVEV